MAAKKGSTKQANAGQIYRRVEPAAPRAKLTDHEVALLAEMLENRSPREVAEQFVRRTWP